MVFLLFLAIISYFLPMEKLNPAADFPLDNLDPEFKATIPATPLGRLLAAVRTPAVFFLCASRLCRGLVELIHDFA